MNKTIFTVLSGLILCVHCFAQQNKFKPEFSIGPFAGITLSKVSFSPKVKENYLPGLTVGAKFRYISENHLGLLLEPNYCIVGWKEDFWDYDPNGNLNYSRSLHYLEIPFMTHVYFGDEQRVFINLGPLARFLIGEKETCNFSSDNAPNTNGSGAYGVPAEHTVDYGLAGGIGIELRTKAGAFMLEGRYYYGLADIFNNHKKDYYAKSANNILSVTLAWMLPVK